MSNLCIFSLSAFSGQSQSIVPESSRYRCSSTTTPLAPVLVREDLFRHEGCLPNRWASAYRIKGLACRRHPAEPYAALLSQRVI